MTVYVLVFLVAGVSMQANTDPMVFATKAICETFGKSFVDSLVGEQAPGAGKLTFQCVGKSVIGW